MRKSAVQVYHDRVAHKYDDIYNDSYWQWHDRLTWDYLKPHLPTNLNAPVVDLGCGTGKWGLKVAQSGYHVTCLDISQGMVDIVRQHADQQNLATKVICLQADLMDLAKLPPHHFSLALAFGEPLCSTAQPAKALKEIRKILQPGGHLIATVDNRLAALDYFLDKADIAGLEAFIQTGKTHWLTKQQSEQFELHTFWPGQLLQILEAAKFELVELLGKTILPMRQYRALLEDKDNFVTLLTLEKKLARRPDALGKAAHVQFVAKAI